MGAKDSPAVSKGILLYGMYGLAGMDRAPEVRIEMMTRALAGQIHTERIVGGRLGRARASVRWILSGGPRRVGAVYVESATSSAMPTDLAFLAAMRVLRRPVGVYFRDAYQLFRDVHPRTHRRQVLSDLLWRATNPLLKAVASVRYAPSRGLATTLGLGEAVVILPPGTDRSAPDLGIGEADVVGAILQLGSGNGFENLVAAMELVRTRRPTARLRLATRSADTSPPTLPSWIEVVGTSRDGLVQALRPCRVCVLPLPVNAYNNLAVSVRLLDLIGLGKPVVATDTHEARTILEASGAGTLSADTAQGLADAILPILDNEALARRMAAGARRYASAPGSTWDDRARAVLESLGLRRAGGHSRGAGEEGSGELMRRRKRSAGGI